MTASRFSAFCLRWADTTVLVGLVVVPLYFNIHALYPFEPSKSVLLSATATTLIGIVALYFLASTSRQETRRRSSRRSNHAPASPDQTSWPQRLWRRFTPPQRALSITFALFLLSQLLATVTSVAPAVSWWGSVPRLQGTSQLLLLAAAVGIVAWRWHEADNERLNRIVAVIFLGAVPVGLYAMAQRLQLDRVAWVYEMQGRVGSTFGNPIFVSAFAALILPIAVVRLLETWREYRTLQGEATHHWAGMWSAVGWLAAGHLPLIALIIGTTSFSTSWWPILPAIAAYGIVCVHVATLRVGLAVRGLGLASLIGIHVGVLTMAIARGPLLAFLAASALLAVLLAQRLGQRVLALFLATAIIVVTSGLIALNISSLPLGELRQEPTLRRLSPLAVPDSAKTIRARLVAWQAGLRAWQAGPPSPRGSDGWQFLHRVVGWGPELFDTAYNQIVTPGKYPDGDFKERWDRAHNVFVDLLVTSGGLGVGSWLLMVGAVGWCGVAAVRHGSRPILACGLLAALAGHIVELQSAFVTAASSWSVWTLAALLAVQARPRTARQDEAVPASPAHARSRRRGRRRSSASSQHSSDSSSQQGGTGPWVAGASVAITIVFVVSVAAGWLAISPYPAHLLGSVWLVSLTFLWAATNSGRNQTRQPHSQQEPLGLGRFAASGIVALMVVALVAWHWRVLAADIYAKVGFQGASPWPERAASLQLAIRLAPTYDLYPVLLGEVLLRTLTRSNLEEPSHPSQPADPFALEWNQWGTLDRDGLAEVARWSFGRALALNGWRYDAYAQLGTLEERITNGPEHLEAAAEAHRRAVALRPSYIHSWLALAKLLIAEDALGSAEQTLLAARAVDPRHTPTLVLLGDVQIQLGRTEEGWEHLWQALSSDPGSWFDDEFTFRVTRAIESGRGSALLAALKTVAQSGASAASRRVYGYALFRMEQWEQARQQLEAALVGTPHDWWARTHLALTLSRLGEVVEARGSATAALQEAPAAQQPVVRQALAGLLGD
ncbi:MAG: hypothetical protein CL878_01690 [Dehalococcoidia bacterium]|nr:hypothetical protein [Dehalococcoidia bacterium]